MKNTRKRKKGIAVGIAALFFMVAGILYFALQMNERNSKVTVYLDGEKEGKAGEMIQIQARVSNIPDNYQACSFAIAFDQNKLRLDSVERGNIEIVNQSTGETTYPEWQYDLDSANQNGSLNIMYLDMTAGEQPICPDGFRENQDMLFCMEFTVLTTCTADDILDIVLDQATFASVDESKTLALQKENLKVKGVQITVVP